LASDVKLPELSIFAMLVAPYFMYRTPPLSTMLKLVVTRFAAFVAFVAVAELPVQAAAVVAVAELPVQAAAVVAVAELPVQAAAVVAVAELPVQAAAVVAVAELPVQDPELPVVFWLSVGNVQFVSVPDEGVPSAPPGAT
jgi:hypothetical protein